MAPVTRSSGPSRGPATSNFAPASQPSSRNEPEVIELDDDDDENDETEDEELDDAGSDDLEDDEHEEEAEQEEHDGDVDDSNEDINGIDSVMMDAAYTVNDHNKDSAVPTLFNSSGIQQALHPLRRAADRVALQMEAFAEKLGHFKQQEYRPGDDKSFLAAFSLLKSFHRHVQDSIQENARQNTLRRAKSGWSSSRDNAPETQNAAKAEDDLRRLQLERDTWELLLNLISIDDPSSRLHAKKSQETAFQNLHRYSTDREIWEQFLEADQYASECVIVMKWLEQKARASSEELDTLISDLEAQAERGQGLWAHGWLYTKETIKGQKRLRSWPQPLEPGDPGITLSLLSSEKQEPLITQLDPDAVTRQKQGLQKQDQYYERATWLTCWKLLRQGESWTKIREWSQERLESWRAVSLCGSSVDEQSSAGKTPVDDGITRMMNCRSQDTWRAACSALARNPNTEDFERGVYALLSGETEPAYQVCHSWDDYLYVFYNHNLLSRYRNFCAQFSRKLGHSPLAKVPFVPDPATYSTIQNFLENLKGNSRVGVEARNPYHTIQAAILGKNYDAFFLSMAKAASEVSKTSGKFDLVPDIAPVSVDSSAIIAVQDQDALRIVAHLYIIIRSLAYIRSDTHFSSTVALTVVAYMDNLRLANLLEFIPLYASFVPVTLAYGLVARVLLEVTDPRDKAKQAKLLDKHHISVKEVLQSQWQWVLSTATQKAPTAHETFRVQRVVRNLKQDPRIMPVRKRFVGTSVSPEDEQMIRCLEWYRFLDRDWTVICELGTFLYKKFLGDGSLIAARELCKRMNLSEISLEMMGFDIREAPLLEENGLGDKVSASPSPTKSPSKKSRQRQANGSISQTSDSRAEMYQQAQLMLDMEQIVVAFDALEEFQLTWEELELSKNTPNSDQLPETNKLKDVLRDALERTAESVESLFDEDGTGVLTESRDGTEAKELEYLRQTYFPEAVLNYCSALYYGSLKLSRDLLVRTMDLSVMIAADQNIIDSFVQSKRMTELVDTMALIGAAMINSPSISKGKKKYEMYHGSGRLDLWNITAEGQASQDKNKGT